MELTILKGFIRNGFLMCKVPDEILGKINEEDKQKDLVFVMPVAVSKIFVSQSEQTTTLLPNAILTSSFKIKISEFNEDDEDNYFNENPINGGDVLKDYKEMKFQLTMLGL